MEPKEKPDDSDGAGVGSNPFSSVGASVSDSWLRMLMERVVAEA